MCSGLSASLIRLIIGFKTSSRALVELLRVNGLPESYWPPPEVALLREKVRRRAFLVRQNTKLKVKIRDVLVYEGIKPPEGYGLFTRKGVEWLRSLNLEPVDCYLRLMPPLSREILHLSKELRGLARDDPDVQLLMSMTGVDYFAAMLILAEVVTVDRFGSDKSFSSWMRLAPRVHQSWEKTWVSGVGGSGNRRMRWLVQCAHMARQYDPQMRRLYERIERRKDGSCAVAAVAHEMARVMFYMLKRGELYRGVRVELWEMGEKA